MAVSLLPKAVWLQPEQLGRASRDWTEITKGANKPQPGGAGHMASPFFHPHHVQQQPPHQRHSQPHRAAPLNGCQIRLVGPGYPGHPISAEYLAYTYQQQQGAIMAAAQHQHHHPRPVQTTNASALSPRPASSTGTVLPVSSTIPAVQQQPPVLLPQQQQASMVARERPRENPASVPTAAGDNLTKTHGGTPWRTNRRYHSGVKGWVSWFCLWFCVFLWLELRWKRCLSFGWSIDWLISEFLSIDWLIDWPTHWLVHWSIDWLIEWIICVSLELIRAMSMCFSGSHFVFSEVGALHFFGVMYVFWEVFPQSFFSKVAELFSNPVYRGRCRSLILTGLHRRRVEFFSLHFLDFIFFASFFHSSS